VLDPRNFPHRWEGSDPKIAERMTTLRKRVAALVPGTAAEHGEVGRGRVRERITHSNGDTAGRAVRRLNRDRPDLAAKVASGELSANAAAVEAGHRPRRFSIAEGDASRAARSLRQHFTAEPGEVVPSQRPSRAGAHLLDHSHSDRGPTGLVATTIADGGFRDRGVVLVKNYTSNVVATTVAGGGAG
jgi:hypothetical protein